MRPAITFLNIQLSNSRISSVQLLMAVFLSVIAGNSSDKSYLLTTPNFLMV